MRYLFLLALLLCGSGALLRAQVTFEVDHTGVGPDPSYVFSDPGRQRVHVLTAGVDANFDGIYNPESGDLSAHWFVLDSLGTIVDSMSFDGLFNSFPTRVGVDLKGGLMYAPLEDAVRIYDIETLELLDPAFVDHPYDYVTYDSLSGVLFLSQTAPDFSSPGTVAAIHVETGLVLGEAKAGINPQMAIAKIRTETGALEFYGLNEGSFGSYNASITRSVVSYDVFAPVNDELLGNGARDVIVDRETAYVLLGGSHLVRMIDTRTHEEIGSLPTGTSGIDYPTSLAQLGDTIVVGTLAGDVRLFSVRKGGTQIGTFDLGGPVIDMVLRGNDLFVAVPGTNDGSIVMIDLWLGRIEDTIATGTLTQPEALFTNMSTGDIIAAGRMATGVPRVWWSVFRGDNLEVKKEDQLIMPLFSQNGIEYDAATHRLAMVAEDTLFVVDLSDPDAEPTRLFVDSSAGQPFYNVDDGGAYWIVTERPGVTPLASYLHLVRKDDGERVMKAALEGREMVGAARLRSSIDGEFAAYTLDGESGPAKLGLVKYHPNMFEGMFGGGANHIFNARNEYTGQEITAVTMNGSHEIVFLDIASQDPSIVLSVPTGTSGSDGPRESALAPRLPAAFAGGLVVTTYSGELLFLANEQVIGRTDIKGKGEGLAVMGDNVYAVNIFETGTYDYDSTVAIVKINYQFDDVKRDAAILAGIAQNRPNPAADRTTIVMSLSAPTDIDLSLYAVDGRRVRTLVSGRMEVGEYHVDVDVRDLPSGAYIYRLSTPAGVESRTMVVR